jgi:hypothetical protein
LPISTSSGGSRSMTIYFMFLGCGFLWQLGGFDAATCRQPYFVLRFYWRDWVAPKREWRLDKADGGLQYTEHTPARKGSWVLRGPWEKVA